MSKSTLFTAEQTTQLAEMVAAAVFAAMSAVEVASEEPAKAAAGTHRNAAGRLVDAHGRFVKATDAPACADKAVHKATAKAAATAVHQATKAAMHDLVNKPLADALRAAGKPANGDAWANAKALLKDEAATVRAAVAAGTPLPSATSFEAAIAAAAVRA